MTAIETKYQQLGGANGFLGVPLHDEQSTADGIGRYITYQNGSIHWHPSTGAFETHGAIRTQWEQLDWENGFLGYPVSDERDYTIRDQHSFFYSYVEMGFSQPIECIGRLSMFQGGCILWENKHPKYNSMVSNPMIETPKNWQASILLRPSNIYPGTSGCWQLVLKKDFLEKGFSFIKNLFFFFSQDSSDGVNFDNIPPDYGRRISPRIQ